MHAAWRYVRGGSLAAMTISRDDPFVRGEIGRAHRPAGVELIGADADFRAKPIFPAVGEACAGVDHDAG